MSENQQQITSGQLIREVELGKRAYAILELLNTKEQLKKENKDLRQQLEEQLKKDTTQET